MKDELPAYIALASGVSLSADVLAWFSEHDRKKKLPWFHRCAELLAIMPTSSAAAERVFSLLKNMFDRQQESALQDMVVAGVMLAPNGRKT